MRPGRRPATVVGVTTGQILNAMRELHRRRADGIHVRLLCSERDGAELVGPLAA